MLLHKNNISQIFLSSTNFSSLIPAVINYYQIKTLSNERDIFLRIKFYQIRHVNLSNKDLLILIIYQKSNKTAFSL